MSYALPTLMILGGVGILALSAATVIGLYREIDDLRDQFAVTEWRIDNTPGAPHPQPVLEGPGHVVWRALTWIRRLFHTGGHRA